MAKVNAPLLSFEASGALAKAMVFFSWKGLNVVRQYVVPTNPKTAKQTTQRGHFSDAVDAIHAMQAAAANALVAADAAAYSLWGSIFATPRTWFNQAVKNFVDVTVAGDTPALFGNGSLDNTTPTEMACEVYTDEATLTDGKWYYGTSKTAMLNSEVAAVAAKACTATVTGLTAGVKYYFQFVADVADPCEGAKSGIYSEYAI